MEIHLKYKTNRQSVKANYRKNAKYSLDLLLSDKAGEELDPRRLWEYLQTRVGSI